VAGRRRLVSVTESVFVARPPQDVFDFTQDYARRAEWDAGVTHAELLSEEPRAARVTIRGLGKATVTYQLFRRPERTSAAFTDVESAWIRAAAAPGSASRSRAGRSGSRRTRSS
jgi:hypothetical protein